MEWKLTRVRESLESKERKIINFFTSSQAWKSVSEKVDKRQGCIIFSISFLLRKYCLFTYVFRISTHKRYSFSRILCEATFGVISSPNPSLLMSVQSSYLRERVKERSHTVRSVEKRNDSDCEFPVTVAAACLSVSLPLLFSILQLPYSFNDYD